MKYAVKVRDTSMQWHLVAAAVEAAVILGFQIGKGRRRKHERKIQSHLQQEN